MKKQVGFITMTYQSKRYIEEVLDAREYGFLSYYPTVVDIGANIGTFSLYMLDHADKIYAIEPVEENIACLRQTIEDNNLTKIVPLQMAVSDTSWVRNMVRDGDPGDGGWKLSESGDYAVDCRTLKDVMESQQIEYIDLLKIDVEGEEMKIIGAPLFPYQRIGTIIGEYHNEGTQKGVKELLEWMGYKYFDLGHSHFLARK